MELWRVHGRGRAAVAGSIAVVLALVAIVMIVTHRSGKHHTAEVPLDASGTASEPVLTTPSRPRPTTSAPKPKPKPAPRTPTTAPLAAVRTTAAKLAAQRPAGGVSVAALNVKTGKLFSYGAPGGMRLGSVAKLLVLETMLREHEQDGSQLSDGEIAMATKMIENSDNKIEYQLYLQAGGLQSLQNTLNWLGMHRTVAGLNDPALSTTTAVDGLQMLAPLVDHPIVVAGVAHKPFSAYSRSVALGMMRNVESDQAWGVSAVADPGTPVALKNGWLSVDNSNGPGNNDDGRWLVNSVGIATVHGQPVLLSAFTQHGPDYVSGIHLVENLVKAITPAVVAE
jgi:hypothetical protein